MKVDWLFKNVTVIDGSGGPQYRADVAVAATSSAGAIAIIRSPFTATSARYCGPPLPSITVVFHCFLHL
jgi:N-acyl-D-aspartate/D-glutamate deacylase